MACAASKRSHTKFWGIRRPALTSVGLFDLARLHSARRNDPQMAENAGKSMVIAAAWTLAPLRLHRDI